MNFEIGRMKLFPVSLLYTFWNCRVTLLEKSSWLVEFCYSQIFTTFFILDSRTMWRSSSKQGDRVMAILWCSASKWSVSEEMMYDLLMGFKLIRRKKCNKWLVGDSGEWRDTVYFEKFKIISKFDKNKLYCSELAIRGSTEQCRSALKLVL